MDITQEKIDAQSALLKVRIQKEDYNEGYDRALKDYRRQLSLPGFRVGKVPLGLVKNRFGKSLLAEEINRMLGDSLQRYIAENKLNILGSPIPSEEHSDQGDWDNPSDFEFVYELGFAPEVRVDFDKNDKLKYYLIDVDDRMLEEHLEEVRQRNGKSVEAEEVEKFTLVEADVESLNADGSVQEDGISGEIRILTKDLEEDVLAEILGKKVDEEFEMDLRKLVNSDEDLSQQLDLDVAAMEMLPATFRLRITAIHKWQSADIDQELFDKVYGEGEINDEAAFRERLREEIAAQFRSESEKLFKRDITRYIINREQPELPDSFLKKYMRLSSDEGIDPEQFEQQYEDYRYGLQWQLIFNKMLEEKHVEVQTDEAIDTVKQRLEEQYKQYGIPIPEEEVMRDTAKGFLQKEETAKAVYDQLYDAKLNAFVKEKATVEEKTVSFDEFVKHAESEA